MRFIRIMAFGFPGILTGETSASFDAARQVLETRCLECHTQEKAKGELVMATRAGMIKGGGNGAALTPGDPESSQIITRVMLPAGDEDFMPPKKSGPPLTTSETEILAAWIKAGAPWPDGEFLSPKAKTALPRWDAPPDPRIVSIEAFPREIHLETAADFHRAIIIVRMKDESTHDVTRQAKATLADPSLARLDGTTLTPKKDGSTTLRIDYRGLSTSIPVTVKDAEKPRPVSFQLDVMPVLTASGCNTGSCHGSARGTGRLPPLALRLRSQGRPLPPHHRNGRPPHQPRHPRGIPVSHQGPRQRPPHRRQTHQTGQRLLQDTRRVDPQRREIRRGGHRPAHRHRGPAQANRPDRRGRPHPVHRPRHLLGRHGPRRHPALHLLHLQRQLGSIASNEGLATSKNRGEAFLLARFHTFTEGSQAIVVPADSKYQRPDVPEANYIDKPSTKNSTNSASSPPISASDEDFLRRVFLDVVGLPPTIEERNKFLADSRPEKRAALVDELLGRKEFTEMWVMKWAELLQIRTFNNGPQQVSYKAALNYYNWLRERIASNVPFNEIVRRDCSPPRAAPSPARPPTIFQIEQDVLKLTENIAQVFMGMRIQCAQCHNHPFDRWTMDDYYGFAAFFAQVGRKPAEDPRERIVFDEGGEVQHPVTKQNMTPKFLGGPETGSHQQVPPRSPRRVAGLAGQPVVRPQRRQHRLGAFPRHRHRRSRR